MWVQTYFAYNVTTFASLVVAVESAVFTVTAISLYRVVDDAPSTVTRLSWFPGSYVACAFAATPSSML